MVDTSVIAYLWIPGTHTAGAEQLLRRDPAWSAPILWRSEFRNVLAGYIRRRLLALATAAQIAEQAEVHMRGREFSVASDEVLRLVAGSRCSAYDCEFVALAEDLGVPLLTTDKQLLAAFPAVARSLAAYAG